MLLQEILLVQKIEDDGTDGLFLSGLLGDLEDFLLGDASDTYALGGNKGLASSRRRVPCKNMMMVD